MKRKIAIVVVAGTFALVAAIPLTASARQGRGAGYGPFWQARSAQGSQLHRRARDGSWGMHPNAAGPNRGVGAGPKKGNAYGPGDGTGNGGSGPRDGTGYGAPSQR